MDVDGSRDPRNNKVLRNWGQGRGRLGALGIVRLTTTGATKAQMSREIILSGRFEYQSQHVALYALAIRQNPDGLSLRDLAEGTGWHKSVVRKAVVNLVEMGIVGRATVFCSYCSRKLSGDETHIDHVVARSLGGPDDPWNRVPVCQSCNSRKSDKPFLIWLMEIGGVTDAP